MKQMTFIEADASAAVYTHKAGSPLYEPKDRRPHILELHDPSKFHRLVAHINAAEGVTADEKRFLIAAAARHTVFNYELIADYYAHATPEMQRLMEESALVILDIESALENGYVQLCDSLKSFHEQEISDES
jgi:hypothetical protein